MIPSDSNCHHLVFYHCRIAGEEGAYQLGDTEMLYTIIPPVSTNHCEILVHIYKVLLQLLD